MSMDYGDMDYGDMSDRTADAVEHIRRGMTEHAAQPDAHAGAPAEHAWAQARVNQEVRS